MLKISVSIINNDIFVWQTHFVEIGEVTTTASPKQADKVAAKVKPFEGKEGKIHLLLSSSNLKILINNTYIYIYIYIKLFY